MYFTKTNLERSYFRFASPPTLERPGHETTPHPRARRAGIVPVVAQGVVTSLIELCINDILENQEPLFLVSSSCVPLLAVVFGSYRNFRP